MVQSHDRYSARSEARSDGPRLPWKISHDGVTSVDVEAKIDDHLVVSVKQNITANRRQTCDLLLPFF